VHVCMCFAGFFLKLYIYIYYFNIFLNKKTQKSFNGSSVIYTGYFTACHPIENILMLEKWVDKRRRKERGIFIAGQNDQSQILDINSSA
jgi:hypothetical protein